MLQLESVNAYFGRIQVLASVAAVNNRLIRRRIGRRGG